MGKSAMLLAFAMVLGTAAMAECTPQTSYRQAKRGTWGFVNPLMSFYGTTYDFATSSSTSGCAPKDWFTIGARHAAQLQFIVESRAHLETDISRGGGPYLSSLLALMGCETSAAVQVRTAIQAQAHRFLGPEALPAARFRGVVAEIARDLPGRPAACVWA